MSNVMRCPYCGLLQDEPKGVKVCSRCGGPLEFEIRPPKATYVQVQMELDQVAAPASVNVERYVLVTIRTPKEVPPDEAAPTETGRLPVNFAAVLDVSGSMQGEKIAQAKAAVQRAVQYLRAGDIFSLVTFAQEVSCPFEPARVDGKTYDAVKKALGKVSAGGMTALCGGLETGIAKADARRQDTNLVLLLSDGQANVGETDLEQVGYRAYQARQQGETVSSLGIGLDYNEALMAEIATQGGGRFYHVTSAHQIPAYLAGELGEVATLAAREVKVHLQVPEGATLLPLSAAFPVQQAAGEAVVLVGDIPCDTELEIPLRLALLAQSADTKLSVDGTLSFRSPAGHEIEIPVNRVTVRFVAQGTFQRREGVVLPVVERVFAQMKPASVLGVARTLATRPQDATRQSESILVRLRAYAELLGEGRAEQEIGEVEEQFDSLRASPAASKQTTSAAFCRIRARKDWGG
ncbi:MAG TPA: VWA domain-containing protein [Anaerolineae bacterium]|nr:VWA domain-containing protein [Anaerolineae bacterium]